MLVPPPRHSFRGVGLVFSIAFSSSGQWLGFSCVGGAVEVWDAAGTKRRAKRPVPPDADPYEKRHLLAVPGTEQFALTFKAVPELVEAATLKSVAVMTPSAATAMRHTVSALAAFPDGRLVTGHKNGAARVWAPSTGKAERRTFDAHIGGPKWAKEIRHLAVMPGGERLVTLHDNGGAVVIWDVATRKCLHVITNASGWIFALHPSGAVLVTTDGGKVSAHHLPSGVEFARHSLGRKGVPQGGKDSLGLLVTGDRVYVSDGDGKVSSFPLEEDGWPAAPPGNVAGQAGVLALSPDGRVLASIDSGQVALYDL